MFELDNNCCEDSGILECGDFPVKRKIWIIKTKSEHSFDVSVSDYRHGFTTKKAGIFINPSLKTTDIVNTKRVEKTFDQICNCTVQHQMSLWRQK